MAGAVALPPDGKYTPNRSAQLVARMLICLMFCASAIMKLQTFDKHTGGAAMSMVGPKLDLAFKRVKLVTGITVPVDKAMYPQILLAYTAVEFMGAALFASDIRFGATLLLAFTSLSAVLLHNFWDYERHPLVFQSELNNFLKNVAIAGGLLYYLASSPGTRYKSKYDHVTDELKRQRAAELAAAAGGSAQQAAAATAEQEDE